MSKLQDMIDLAYSQVGYREKKSNSQLDDFTANAGAGNWTKYGRDLAEAGFFGGKNKNGYEWCTSFVTWLAYKVYGTREAAEALLCQTGIYAASCTLAAGYYKAQGRYDNTPSTGAQVFFKPGGQIGHTGYVVEVKDGYITAIEGNCENQVKKNRYKEDDPYIDGYGHPRYLEMEYYEPPKEQLDDGRFLLQFETAMPGSKGPGIAALQGYLQYAGFPPGKIDGEYGPKTRKAIGELQKKIGAKVDYEFGPETAAKAMPELFVDTSVTVEDEAEEVSVPVPPVIPADDVGVV